MQINNNFSLIEYNTFGIDVHADTFVSYDSQDELAKLISNEMKQLPSPVLHIGEGSNLLFMNDFKGTILYSRIKTVEVLKEESDSIIVKVGSGWKMDDFIQYCLKHNWYGLENLSHIPGQVGASAVQNIGAYGVEVGDCISAVNCISLENGEKRRFTNQECEYAYRHSIFKSAEFKGRYAVTSVEYTLKKEFCPNLTYKGIVQCLSAKQICINNVTPEELRNTIIEIRKNKLPDPKVFGNAGSFFMNPIVSRKSFLNLQSSYPNIPFYEMDADKIKIPTAWLIEKCGWKGRSLGKAGVHGIQPLVLINLGGANGDDILRLSKTIQTDILRTFGISICPEVNIIY